MNNVGRAGRFAQAGLWGGLGVLLLTFWLSGKVEIAASADASAKEQPAADVPAVLNPDAEARAPSEMKKYTEQLSGTEFSFDMVPIPGGEYVMGSPENEAGRKDDESPQHKVKIAPFWMGKCEVTWDTYETYSYGLDAKGRDKVAVTPRDAQADAITRPSRPYVDMAFGMGKMGTPAVCMTGLAAKTYCDWLSAKTGRFYRLPTEAEWEYACRAGTKTAYSFGEDPAQLGEYAWHLENSDERFHLVGTKKPNAWGLYDMHGNVAEWCLDQYAADYKKFTPDATYFLATKEYPQVVRGGSFLADAAGCRSAARDYSKPAWKIREPMIPKSRWYHSDASFVGFRVVRPFAGEDIKLPPTEPNKKK